MNCPSVCLQVCAAYILYGMVNNIPQSTPAQRVKIDGERLRYFRERRGLSQQALADQVSGQLKGLSSRGKRTKREMEQRGEAAVTRRVPTAVYQSHIGYWETGRRKKCDLSVITVLAKVLRVRPENLLKNYWVGDFGETTGRSDYIPFELPIPGRPQPLRFEVQVVGHGQIRGLTGQRPTDIVALAGIWMSLPWWRKRFFPQCAYDSEEVESGTVLRFTDHMAKALEILLLPMGKGTRLRALGLLELLSTGDPDLRKSLPQFYQSWEPRGKEAIDGGGHGRQV